MDKEKQLDMMYEEIKDRLRKIHLEVVKSDQTLHLVDLSNESPPRTETGCELPGFARVCSVTLHSDHIVLIAEELAGKAIELRLREGGLRDGMPWWVMYYEKREPSVSHKQSASHTQVLEEVEEFLQKVMKGLLEMVS